MRGIPHDERYGGDIMYSWDIATIDAYKPIQDHKGWKKCKVCKEIPRIWEFNNGSHAKCRCSYKYDESRASSESILSYVKRNNGSALNYDHDGLRKAWNKFIETGESQNKLPEGQW